MIPTDDRGLLLGDGLFETVLLEKGVLVWWEAHLARLARACERLGLPAPEAVHCFETVMAAVDRAGLDVQRQAVRLTLTAGSGGRGLERPASLAVRMFATVAPAPETHAPLSMVTSTVRRNEASPASRLKTLAYLDNVLARREALKAGAQEALMLNVSGEIACAAAANVFWSRGGRIFTPALECGVLDGIARAHALAGASHSGSKVCEVRADWAELQGADAVVVTNSLVGARPVGTLDGRSLASEGLSAQIMTWLGTARGV